MKKSIKILSLISISAFITSCTVQRELLVVDGSKADGTVTLAAEYPLGPRVKVDVEKARQKAEEKCKAWGYQNADFFDTGVDSSIGNGKRRIVYKAQCTN